MLDSSSQTAMSRCGVFARGDIFDKMNDSSFEFCLTGSRFFGTDTFQSDWDFYCGNTAVQLSTADNLASGMPLDTEWTTVGNFLRYLGFVVDESGVGYDGLNCAKVYIHTGVKIHVQVVRDPKKKKAAQDALRKWGKLHVLDSPKAIRSIWELVYQLLPVSTDD